MTAYFDDFPCITFEGLADISHFAAEKLLDILGINFSMKDHKRLKFANKFILLGVEIKFPYFDDPVIFVDNTVDRKLEVEYLVEEIIKAGVCHKGVAATLFGKLGFMSSQTWSRVGPLLTWAIKRRAQEPDADDIDDDLRASLDAASVLVNAPPRQVVVASERRVRWILTDAAAEPSGDGKHRVTIGAVMLSFSGRIARHFSEEVPAEVVNLWSDTLQPITYAESLAVLAAKAVWNGWMKECDCVFAVDNVGAQQSLIRYNSSSLRLREVLRAHLVLDARYGIHSWITWVPSESNLADRPSRLDESVVLQSGSVRDRIINKAWSAIVALMRLSIVAVAKTFAQR